MNPLSSDPPAPPSRAPTILDPSSGSESEADTYLDTLKLVDSRFDLAETLIVDTVDLAADISMVGIVGELLPTSGSAVGDSFICENDNDGPAVEKRILRRCSISLLDRDLLAVYDAYIRKF